MVGVWVLWRGEVNNLCSLVKSVMVYEFKWECGWFLIRWECK